MTAMAARGGGAHLLSKFSFVLFSLLPRGHVGVHSDPDDEADIPAVPLVGDLKGGVGRRAPLGPKPWHGSGVRRGGS